MHQRRRVSVLDQNAHRTSATAGPANAPQHIPGGTRAARPWRNLRVFAAGVMAPLLLLGCSPSPTSVTEQDRAAATAPEAVPKKSAPCVKAVPHPFRWDGYSEQLQDACVGPTHFRFPANLFRDQIGPDFQGNFTLVLMWPDLKPAAPGKLNGQPLEQQRAWVTVSPDYVDRVPIETRLEAFIAPLSFQVGDPAKELALRDRQPDRFGLAAYYVNPQRFEDHKTQENLRLGMKSRAKIENTDDWYLQRDANGRLTTVIKCDSHLEPDGYTALNGRLVKNPTERTNALCSHHFVMEDIKARVEISYARVLLGDWKKFEDRAHALLTDQRVR